MGYEINREQEKFLNALLIAGVIIGLFLVVFIASLVKQWRRSRKLAKEKMDAEITVLEKTQQKIAADLHDDLGPLLGSARMQLSMLKLHGRDAETVTLVTMCLDRAIASVKTLSRELVPVSLAKQGIVEALRDFISLYAKENTMQVHFHEPSVPLNMRKEQEIHLYRLVTEIVNNAVMHAQPSAIILSMSLQPAMLNVSVRDDGNGFVYEKVVESSSGLGLKNIFERAEILKAKVYLDTFPGKGTKYTIEIPISDEQATDIRYHRGRS